MCWRIYPNPLTPCVLLGYPIYTRKGKEDVNALKRLWLTGVAALAITTAALADGDAPTDISGLYSAARLGRFLL